MACSKQGECFQDAATASSTVVGETKEGDPERKKDKQTPTTVSLAPSGRARENEGDWTAINNKLTAILRFAKHATRSRRRTLLHIGAAGPAPPPAGALTPPPPPQHHPAGKAASAIAPVRPKDGGGLPHGLQQGQPLDWADWRGLSRDGVAFGGSRRIAAVDWSSARSLGGRRRKKATTAAISRHRTRGNDQRADSGSGHRHCRRRNVPSPPPAAISGDR